jgi:flagellar biosynthesis protein FlhA
MALLPGMPMLPFLAPRPRRGCLAFHAQQGNRGARPSRQSVARKRRGRPPPPRPRADLAALKIDDLKIELGYGLLPLVKDPNGTDR